MRSCCAVCSIWLRNDLMIEIWDLLTFDWLVLLLDLVLASWTTILLILHPCPILILTRPSIIRSIPSTINFVTSFYHILIHTIMLIIASTPHLSRSLSIISLVLIFKSHSLERKCALACQCWIINTHTWTDVISSRRVSWSIQLPWLGLRNLLSWSVCRLLRVVHEDWNIFN